MAMAEVAPGVWRAGTRWVNWYVVDGGADGLTIVDAGLPGYGRGVARELAAIGRGVADVRAVLLTHGHIDHVGAAGALAAEGATVFLHPRDTELAADPRSNKTERSVVPYLRWPATLGFIAHALREGALRPAGVPSTRTIADGQRLDVPGSPVVTHAPGHTEGSCVFEFGEHGVLFAGDLLCTASPVTGRLASPRIQTRGSNLSSAETIRSLERIRGVGARIVLPGHGDPWRDGVEAAVASAKAVGCA